MLKQPSFYVIYIMMTLVAFGGLVVTAQIKPIAIDSTTLTRSDHLVGHVGPGRGASSWTAS